MIRYYSDIVKKLENQQAEEALAQSEKKGINEDIGCFISSDYQSIEYNDTTIQEANKSLAI